MNAGTKLGAYGLVLAAVLGGGAVVGAATGPIDVGGDAPHDTHTEEDATMPTTSTAELPAGGLLVAQDGYSLEPEDRIADAGSFAFTITGPDGEPVRDYELLHDRELHLIVASRDLQSYAHLHPTRDETGRWSVELPALAPGAYRAFADFQPAGAQQYTLGIDLTSPGTPSPAAPLQPKLADQVDGLDARLDVHTGEDGTELTVTVRRGGEVLVTEPYLAAAGHLVALRDGDLAYLHVHPLDDEPSGPVRFAAEVPSEGTYALFFDFQVDGVVRTASFVIDVTTTPVASHGAHEG
jgi:hypothetical protein